MTSGRPECPRFNENGHRASRRPSRCPSDESASVNVNRDGSQMTETLRRTVGSSTRLAMATSRPREQGIKAIGGCTYPVITSPNHSVTRDAPCARASSLEAA
jgi:hypothetical protein